MTLPGSPSLLAQFRRLCLLALCTALLAACGQPKPSFKNVDISGATEFGKDFALLDPSGKTRTLADFKGKAGDVLRPRTAGTSARPRWPS